MIARFRRHYGASPLQLLGHLAAFAITLYALSIVLETRYARPINFAFWFAGSALLHDLVFLPLYLGLGRLARGAVHGVPVANFVRVPAVVSGVLFLAYFPLILQRSPGNYLRDTGRHLGSGYASRWLLVTAVLFAGSAVLYAVRVRGATARARRSSAP